MNNATNIPKTIILWFVGLLLLIGCVPQEPIRIVVTATPQATTEAATTVTSVAQASPVAQERTVTNTSEPTPSPSLTPTRDRTPETTVAEGDDGFFGPIIDADYTPPPTSTPRPTMTPIPPTATPVPETPVATPLDATPMLDGSQMGVQLYYNLDVDAWWQMMQRTKQVRVGWVKMQANWSWLQPDHPNQFDTTFRLFQLHVERAHREGFQVLLSVAKAPAWARNGITEMDGPPADPQALAYFINFLLDKVGDEVAAVEIWNEPNLRREWTGNLPQTGAAYMSLFQAGYDAVRAYSPDITVVTAGLAPTGTNTAAGNVDDRLYLRQMYAAGLATSGYSNIAVGIHPYGWGNPPDIRCCNQIPDRGWDDDPHFFFIHNIEEMREIMVENGHANVQLWATEFGWSSWAGIPTEPPEPWMRYTSPNQQAQYTLRAFEIAQSLDYVGVMILWNLNFANPTLIEQRNEMVGYSLFIPGVEIRPLYHQLVNRP